MAAKSTNTKKSSTNNTAKAAKNATTKKTSTAKKNNVKYNSNGIQLGKKEYMQLKSAINTDTPNLKKGINYKSLGNYFYIFDKYAFDNYNVLGRIKIIGNEKIINEILKGVDKKDDAGTKNINKLLEHSQNEQGIYTIDNINAVDSRGTAKNGYYQQRYHSQDTQHNTQGYADPVGSRKGFLCFLHDSGYPILQCQFFFFQIFIFIVRDSGEKKYRYRNYHHQ